MSFRFVAVFTSQTFAVFLNASKRALGAILTSLQPLVSSFDLWLALSAL